MHRYHKAFPCRLEPSSENPSRIMPTGNDAVALGAIQAGCKFYAAKPRGKPSADKLDESGNGVMVMPDEVVVTVTRSLLSDR